MPLERYSGSLWFVQVKAEHVDLVIVQEGKAGLRQQVQSGFHAESLLLLSLLAPFTYTHTLLTLVLC